MSSSARSMLITPPTVALRRAAASDRRSACSSSRGGRQRQQPSHAGRRELRAADGGQEREEGLRPSVSRARPVILRRARPAIASSSRDMSKGGEALEQPADSMPDQNVKRSPRHTERGGWTAVGIAESRAA